jgi:hypothetical protein
MENFASKRKLEGDTIVLAAKRTKALMLQRSLQKMARYAPESCVVAAVAVSRP